MSDGVYYCGAISALRQMTNQIPHLAFCENCVLGVRKKMPSISSWAHFQGFVAHESHRTKYPVLRISSDYLSTGAVEMEG